MSNWKNLSESLKRLMNNPQLKGMLLGSPVKKIIAANTAMFV